MGWFKSNNGNKTFAGLSDNDITTGEFKTEVGTAFVGIATPYMHWQAV
jgi:hypothetical protein